MDDEEKKLIAECIFYKGVDDFDFSKRDDPYDYACWVGEFEYVTTRGSSDVALNDELIEKVSAIGVGLPISRILLLDLFFGFLHVSSKGSMFDEEESYDELVDRFRTGMLAYYIESQTRLT